MAVHTATRLTPPVGKYDHVRGPATAPLTLVEYGDYECPYCGMAYPVVEALRGQFQNQLRFVFRHFPLVQVHPHAFRAAQAAEAAGEQGKFWEMHDTLYTHQGALDDVHLLGYAAALGLDTEAFAHALAEGTWAAERVREYLVSGMESGVTGTPTFFINEIRYEGPYDFDSLSAALASAAEASGQ